MKSERRHELQHNVLADWLAKSAQSLKPYQNMVLWAVTLVLVAGAAYAWWSRSMANQATEAWDELNTALESSDPAKLAKVIDDLPGTIAADMAAVVSADYHLAEGCSQLFINKATAREKLKKAIELYDLVREHKRMPWLMERATFGLALAKEAKGEATDIDQAMQLYEEVATTWPNGAYAATASQRLEDLKRPATKGLYDRFAHFDPKPVFSSEPGGRSPFDLNSLPNEGPLYVPSNPLNLKPDEKAKGKEEEAGGNKPSESAKPSDETKASEEKKGPEETGKPEEAGK